jgi:oligopeptidase B
MPARASHATDPREAASSLSWAGWGAGQRAAFLVLGALLVFHTAMSKESAPVAAPPAPLVEPPVAARKDHPMTWHGETVNDPYFWLREKTNPEVIRYLEAENAFTESRTTQEKAFGEKLYTEILGRIQQTDLSVPVRRGAFEYFSRTVEGRQYPIHMRRAVSRENAESVDQVLLDLNQLAEGRSFLGLGGIEVSDDGNQLLYSTDVTGFRQYTLYRKDLVTGQTGAALAERVRGFEWAADGRTVFYVTEDEVTKRSDKLWRLDLQGGKPELVVEEKDELFSLGVSRTKDRKFLVCGSGSTDTWEQRILSSAEPQGRFRVVIPRERGHKYDVEHRDGLLYLRTNRGAKNFRLVTAPVGSPTQWTEVLAHRSDVLLEGLEVFERHLVVQEQREALTRLRIQDLRSGDWREVSFPEPVYWASASGTPEYGATHVRLNYQSMVTPQSVYDCALGSGELTLLKRTAVLGTYDPARYVTERRWAVARDGVRVPLSVMYLKGTPMDGTAPCHLYGYGSYGLGMEASFSIPRLSLVDRGMVSVIAHIRGGNEMGEGWHDDGMLMRKKNTFHDFIDSAEWLVAQRIVARDRIVIEGGSAGGLLMGAVVNLRPDLFRAVHSAVPFVDVLNTMMDASLPLTVGEYLEWGNPNEKAAFDYMRSYSPYDNLRRAAYPAMLVTTSLNDSQVMYWEPAKYVAKLRTLKTDSNPLLLKCNMGAGHGGASGRYDRLKEVAFEYAWLMRQVGIEK